MTTTTPRVSGAPTIDSTKRVTTQGVSGGTPASLGSDSWGNSWGFTAAQPSKAWGRSWLTATPAVPPSGEKPELISTPRISGAPAGTITKRVIL
jgi:hypothetical protein